MNLCVDQGNTNIKAGIFTADKLIETFVFPSVEWKKLFDLKMNFPIDTCIVSSVKLQQQNFISIFRQEFQQCIELNSSTKIPVNNLYKTPQTLGNDRLAAVIGAQTLQPDTDLLVIDAGTAITFDFIDAQQNFYGGNIAAGIDLRLKALNAFTDRLPLVEQQEDCPFPGIDTRSAILSGAIYGIVFEIDGYINELKIKYPKLSTFLTGGSTFYFESKLKNAIFAEKNLVLIGLNRILQYNVQK